MKKVFKIIVFLIIITGIIFGTKWLVKKIGPRDFKKRLADKHLTTQKRIRFLKKKLEKTLEIHRQHISTINSLNKIYKELAAVSQDKIKNLEVLSNTQTSAGNEYLKAQYLEEAIKYYNLALQLNPRDVEAIINSGICHYNIGLYESDPVKAYKEFLISEKLYKNAINISSTRRLTTDKQWQKKGLLYLALLYRVIKENGYNKKILYSGLAGAKRDFIKIAIETTKKLYKIDPDNPECLFMLGALYYMRKDYNMAKHYYTLIVASNSATVRQRKKAQKFINRVENEIREPRPSR